MKNEDRQLILIVLGIAGLAITAAYFGSWLGKKESLRRQKPTAICQSKCSPNLGRAYETGYNVWACVCDMTKTVPE